MFVVILCYESTRLHCLTLLRFVAIVHDRCKYLEISENEDAVFSSNIEPADFLCGKSLSQTAEQRGYIFF